MKEGYLQKNSDGRYELISKNGEYLTYFTSGDTIVLFDADEEIWLEGRVEYNHNLQDYYFYKEDGLHLNLYNGDKVRCK